MPFPAVVLDPADISLGCRLWTDFSRSLLFPSGILKLRAINGSLGDPTLDLNARKTYEQQRKELQQTVEKERLVDIDSEFQ